MLKCLAILSAVIIGLTIYVACQNQGAASQGQQQGANPTVAPVSPSAHDEQAQNNTNKASGNLPGWYRLFAWPDGTTAWAIILTLIAIAEQTRQTAIAAKATRQATEHLISSERAWVLATEVRLTSGAKDSPYGVDQVFIHCAAKNVGNSAARVLSLKAIMAIGPISDPGKTWDEDLYSLDKKATPRWVIMRDKNTALNCPIPGFKANPGDKVAAPLGPDETTFIHGVIRYWDMFSETNRFTRFCYRWQKPPDGISGDGYYPAGGDRYNQQT